MSNSRSGLSVAAEDPHLTEERVAMTPTDWITHVNQIFTNLSTTPTPTFPYGYR